MDTGDYRTDYGGRLALTHKSVADDRFLSEEADFLGMETLNQVTMGLVDEAIDFADELRIEVRHLENDGVVLDFGVNADGGIEAGLLLTEIQTSGLATIQVRGAQFGEIYVPRVTVSSDQPLLALLCSQKQRLSYEINEFTGIGCGPARFMIRDSPEFDYVQELEEADFGVVCLESSQLPGPEVAARIAHQIDIPTSGVFLVDTAPTSICGIISSTARIAEVAVSRLMSIGYDPRHIVSVIGDAPVAPSDKSNVETISSVLDGIVYGGRVHLTVTEDDNRFDQLAFNATDRYGQSFTDTITDSIGNFSDVDDVVAPAVVTIDVQSGSSYTYGGINSTRVAESFGYEPDH